MCYSVSQGRDGPMVERNILTSGWLQELELFLFAGAIPCDHPAHMSSTALLRPTLLPDDPFIPRGNYDSWDEEETAQAEVRAHLFALEYVRDFSYKDAAIRLGVDPALAGKVGKALHGHWLTRAYIEQLQDRYIKDEILSRDRVAALVMRDASNFGAGSNSMARVSAQKTLVQILGMDQDSRKGKEVAALEAAGISAGVMFVPLFGSESTWEEIAKRNQQKIREEADSDDSEIEGSELL